MATFYTFPANMQVAQTGGASVVSDRSLKTSVSAGNITLETGGVSTNTLFLITAGATVVNTFTANTPNTATEYYLEPIRDRQYTLYSYTATTADITLDITGGRVYRAMVMSLVHRFGPNRFFSQINPNRGDRAGVVHESIRGNVNVQRRADADTKRQIQYRSALDTSKTDADMLKFIYDTYPNFAFSRNPLIHFDEVFPAYFDGQIGLPYGTWNWEAGYQVTFTIAEA